MYGIDELHGNTSAASFAAVHGSRAGDLEVRLDNWLAAPEYRAMSALAYDSTPTQATRRLRHPVSARGPRAVGRPDVRALLAGLSIRIREKR